MTVKATNEKPIRELPPERAFVLQLEADANLSTDEWGGRVEHVATGFAARFRSYAQLLAFLRRVLGATAREETTDEAQNPNLTPRENSGSRE